MDREPDRAKDVALAGSSRPRVPADATRSRRIVVLVESDAALSRILTRELSARSVIAVTGVAEALRALEREAGAAVVLSSYKLKDGTARKLFVVAKRRWPRLLRILYAEPERLTASSTRAAVALSDHVVKSFAELHRVLD